MASKRERLPGEQDRHLTTVFPECDQADRGSSNVFLIKKKKKRAVLWNNIPDTAITLIFGCFKHGAQTFRLSALSWCPESQICLQTRLRTKIFWLDIEPLNQRHTFKSLEIASDHTFHTVCATMPYPLAANTDSDWCWFFFFNYYFIFLMRSYVILFCF